MSVELAPGYQCSGSHDQSAFIRMEACSSAIFTSTTSNIHYLYYFTATSIQLYNIRSFSQARRFHLNSLYQDNHSSESNTSTTPCLRNKLSSNNT
jgi:hypothetical protein